MSARRGLLRLVGFAACVSMVAASLAPPASPSRAAAAPRATTVPLTTTTTSVPATTVPTTVPVTSTSPPQVSSTSPSGPPSAPSAPPAPAPPLPAQLASTGGAHQLIVVDSPDAGSTSATLTTWQLEGGTWVQMMPAMAARTGGGGWRWPSDRHEGDGSTPIGLFGIGPTIYGVNPDPGGLRYGFHQLIPGDYWDENPASPTYNTFQHSAITNCAANPFGGDTECLWTETVAYQYFAVIEFNPAPTSNPMGSGVFLHVGTDSPTAGCVSLSVSDLLAVLRWLDPAQSPAIVEAPDAALRSL